MWQRYTLLLAGALLFGMQASRGDEAPLSREYQIKAAFVYNIAKFVEWPPPSLSSNREPIVIGVFGMSPFGTELDVIVKDRKINGHGIVVRQITTAQDIKGMHLLFVGSSDDQQFVALKAVIQGSPILTIGESRSFAAADGMINFVMVGDKVRFEINMEAADTAGLKISAQLQKLASYIRRSP